MKATEISLGSVFQRGQADRHSPFCVHHIVRLAVEEPRESISLVV